MHWLGSPAHARRLEAETDRLLEFARGSRRASGGFGWLDVTGRDDAAQPVHLWITCRMTHVFALGALLGRPGCRPLVDHGVAALDGMLRDAEHGGWFAAASPDGPVSDRKEAYGHAFVVLAASSAAAAGHPAGRALLAEALDVVDGTLWRDDDGMVVDSTDRTWVHVEDYRGVNANMHLVEALLAAADVTGDRGRLDQALRVAQKVMGFAEHTGWQVPEHFTTAWEPVLDYNADSPADQFRPYGVTVGHGLEWARLLLHLDASLGADAPGWLREAAVGLFGAATGKGWHADGAPGFVYTHDWQGVPVVRNRMHWVAAEAVGAAATLARVFGDEHYHSWYETVWDHVDAVHLDRAGGSWWHEADPDGRPASTVWAGKPDVYHALQATLVPRLPVAPSLATALARGLLDT